MRAFCRLNQNRRWIPHSRHTRFAHQKNRTNVPGDKHPGPSASTRKRNPPRSGRLTRATEIRVHRRLSDTPSETRQGVNIVPHLPRLPIKLNPNVTHPALLTGVTAKYSQKKIPTNDG